METNGAGTGDVWVWVAVMVLGTGFGILYNFFVTWLSRRGWKKGATAGLVVIGVLVTLFLSVPLTGLVCAIKIGALFLATGWPMIVGDWVRYAIARQDEAQDVWQALQEALDDDEKEDRRI